MYHRFDNMPLGVLFAALLALTYNADAAFSQDLVGDSDQAARVLNKSGIAETDITPRSGMLKLGNYFKYYQAQFHDPCKVRAADCCDGRHCARTTDASSRRICRGAGVTKTVRFPSE